MRAALFLWAFLLGSTQATLYRSHCDELVCASVVSKCMLTQACKCEISREHENCKCCGDCVKCLGSDYFQCCACLGLCNPHDMEIEQTKWMVGDLTNPFKELFSAITKEADEIGLHGKVFKYPTDKPIDVYNHKAKEFNTKKGYDDDHPSASKTFAKTNSDNCSVIFLGECHSAAKCRDSCDSFGASKFRFFYDGCCQCVGPTCLDYGIDDSRCPNCSYDLVDDNEWDDWWINPSPDYHIEFKKENEVANDVYDKEKL